MKVLIDTNFFLTMVRYKIHAISEIKEKVKAEFYTLSGVVDELVYLAKDKKIKRELNLIKQIIEKNKIEVIKSKENVDEELIKKSKEFIIATNDKELRERIKEFGGKSIYIKKLALIDMSEVLN
jgi:rRNA-processing protein FCF1